MKLIRNLLLHSRAGGGLNICQSGLGHTSHVVGMWNDICRNSCPLCVDVPGLSSFNKLNSWTAGVLPSSGFLASPSPA